MHSLMLAANMAAALLVAAPINASTPAGPPAQTTIDSSLTTPQICVLARDGKCAGRKAFA